MSRQYTSTLTTKGQITIPVKVRENLDLQEGDKVLFTEEKEGYLLTKVEEGVIYTTCPHCNGTGRCKIKKESDSR